MTNFLSDSVEIDKQTNKQMKSIHGIVLGIKRDNLLLKLFYLVDNHKMYILNGIKYFQYTYQHVKYALN